MSVIAVLKQAEIFDELTTTQLELIASIAQEKQYNAGELVFFENTASDSLYVIANGAIDIQVDPSIITDRPAGEAHTIATLRHGQSFGEIALVDQGFRSASARCVEDDTRLVMIPREKLMLLCDTYPQLGYRLMRNLAADLAMKIRNTDLKVRDQILWAQNEKPA